MPYIDDIHVINWILVLKGLSRASTKVFDVGTVPITALLPPEHSLALTDSGRATRRCCNGLGQNWTSNVIA